MKYIIYLLLYMAILLFNIVSRFIPGANYLDEILLLISVILTIIKLLKEKRKIKIKSIEMQTLLAVGSIIIIGFISTLLFKYTLDLKVIIKDIILTFKFIISYFCFNYIFRNYKSKYLLRYMVALSKVVIVVVFMFGVISLFYDVGMVSGNRLGLRPYKFLYTHYTYLVYNTVIMMSVLFADEKDNFIYKTLGIIILALTLRSKAFAIAVVIIIIQLKITVSKFNLEHNKNINIFNRKSIIVSVLLLLVVTKDKILTYLSWGVDFNLRNGLHYVGYKIAKDHFPFGSGFGTFATNISYEYNSPIYLKYKMLGYQGFTKETIGVPMSDVFWPSIYGQFGIIGVLLFLFCIINILRSLIINKNTNKINIVAPVIIWIYLLLASTVEATYTNETGVFSSIIMVLTMTYYPDS